VNEFEALEQAYQKECFKLDALAVAIREIEAQGIARDTVVALEEYCPELVTGDYPLASYTRFPSETNLGFAMEGLGDRLLKAAFAAVMKILDLWIELNRWIAKKILQLVRYALESKFGNRTSSWWDDIKSTMRSEEANVAIELYTKLANTQLCEFVEDNADKIPDDESLYNALIEVNEVSVTILEDVISSIAARRAALDRGESIPEAGGMDALVQQTDENIRLLWTSGLNEYGEEIDDYVKNAPNTVPSIAMYMQIKDFITLGYPDPPKVVDVLQTRVQMADYLKDNQRLKQGSLSKVERLYKRGLLESKKIDRLEKTHRISSEAVNKALSKVSGELDKLMSIKAGNVDGQEMVNYVQMVRAGSATMMRFAKACQYAVVFQNRINDTRGTIVSALNSVLAENANSKK